MLTQYKISVSTDDGQWREGDSNFSAGTTEPYIGELTAFGWGSVNIYLRFQNVRIPKGALVTNAWVRLSSGASLTSTTVNLLISAVDSPSPLAPTTYNEAENATRTSANIEWNNLPSWDDDPAEYDTPDISDVIQELVGSYPDVYNGGSANILLYIEDNGSSTDASRRIKAFDDASGNEAVLYIEYAEPKPIVYGKYAPRFIPTAPNKGWILNRPPLDMPFELNRNSPQADGLIVWFPILANTVLGLVKNYAIAGLDGLFEYSNGVFFINGERGRVLGFSGLANTGRMILHHQSILSPAHISIAMWIYRTRADVWSKLIDKDVDTLFNSEFRFDTGSDGDHLRVLLRGASSTGTVDVDEACTLNEWILAGFTYDGTTLTLYKNGLSIGTPATTAGPRTTTTDHIYIGNYDASNAQFGGCISDTRIYNRCLSPQEMWDMWNPATRWELYASVVKPHHYHIPTPHKTRRFSIR